MWPLGNTAYETDTKYEKYDKTNHSFSTFINQMFIPVSISKV